MIMKHYDSHVYKIYTEEKLNDIEFELDIRKEHFPNRENDIKCVGETVYVYISNING